VSTWRTRWGRCNTPVATYLSLTFACRCSFHLSDGLTYTHLDGSEYQDIAAAWDWNLVPGITTDYAQTPLSCATVQKTNPNAFVGGVSDGVRGVSVMRYTNPITGALSWNKAWFFLEDDVQHVMVANVSSSSNAEVRVTTSTMHCTVLTNR